MYRWLKKLMITELAINAVAKTMPFTLKIRLFVNADKYWIIEICQNLKSKFETPIMIFSSFSKLMNGK